MNFEEFKRALRLDLHLKKSQFSDEELRQVFHTGPRSNRRLKTCTTGIYLQT
eukprot:COSAG05_NODE_57_length_23291_cov_75.862668_21_plen_52_part_00